MAEYVIETLEEVIQRMVDYYRTAQSDITDFNEGSEIRNLLSAVGVAAWEVRYYIDWMLKMGYPHTAEGDYLDMLGVLVDCYRKPAEQAVGTVVYTLGTAVAYDITIPLASVIGTTTDVNLLFETTEEAILVAGQTSIIVDAQAQAGGVEGNIAIGILDTLGTPIDDLEVSNTAAFTGGAIAEEDGDFRIRILEAGKSGITGSISWYKNLVNAVTGVHDSAIVNNPFGNQYSMTIYVNGETKPTSDSVIEDVEAVFLDEDNIIGGVTLEVVKPDYSVQDVTATVSIDPTYSWSSVESDITDNITAYFDGGITTYDVTYLGLNIAEDIIQSRIELLIANTEGVTDYNVSDPSGNIVMAVNGAAQLGTITLTEV